MSILTQVDITPLQPERFDRILSNESYSSFAEAMDTARALFQGRTVWNVNSTGKGGGVAEMLTSLIAYAQGIGVDARWVVIAGDPGFFEVTKRIHNHLHGAEGDGGQLQQEQHAMYEKALAPNEEELLQLIGAEDVVILHDPQTAGLARGLVDKGIRVIWRCHVGLDTPNDIARGAWEFLRGYVSPAHRYVFSRRAFAWEKLDDEKLVVIPPSIDAFSPKNQDMAETAVDAILVATGLMQGEASQEAVFTEVHGGQGRVERPTEMYGAGPFAANDRLVVQVSRWDRLKDPLGVMKGFVDHIAPPNDAHLVLAGPSVAAVSDDPEGKQVLDEVRAAWDRLDDEVAARIHLACLPMDDGQENAAIVNALQRKATVIVQKSLAEGFGLTVAEGMWKRKPVVATRIGGIQDQIEDGISGVLIDNARDLEAYGSAVGRLLDDPTLVEAMGSRARERVLERFLGPRHLIQYLEVCNELLNEG
jgi:trehalose synthase